MTADPPPALLEAQGLSVSFRGVPAVRDVSLRVEPGQILGIVGESGSGKSVTCRALMGLLPKSAEVTGSVRWKGRELLTLSEGDWRAVRGPEMGMIFQNPSSHLDPLKRIGGQVAAPMRRHLRLSRTIANTRAVELLEAVGILEPSRSARSYPHHFSGGMKQRAMIAAAIGCGPKLLIADEPTTALDVTVQARILQLLKKLNRERGLAIILISHDLRVIADICTFLMVMRHGAVVERGLVAEIVERPRHPYTRLLIDSQPGRRRPGAAAPPAAAVPPLLAIEKLTVAFPRRSGFLGGAGVFLALDGVDLSVTEGETVGIVGESGSGKTTLARAIVGLNRPSGGTIRFAGEDISALQGESLAGFRRRAQMVFQSPYDSLNPSFTVAETIAEPIWRHGLMKRSTASAEADRLLDMVELPRSLRDRRPRQLSGGQCQRVGIARALALDPQLLIADEITSALDVTTQAQILELLARLQQERRLTVLYISHDLSVVSAFCHRVYVFKDGRVVESGSARQVLTQPEHAYTRELVASLTQLERRQTQSTPVGMLAHAP